MKAKFFLIVPVIVVVWIVPSLGFYSFQQGRGMSKDLLSNALKAYYQSPWKQFLLVDAFAFEKHSLGSYLDRMLQNMKAVVRKLCSLAMRSGVFFWAL